MWPVKWRDCGTVCYPGRYKAIASEKEILQKLVNRTESGITSCYPSLGWLENHCCLYLFLPYFSLSLSLSLVGWPQHYFLKGHTGRVTTLLYPSDYSSAYDSNHLVSGGSDFSVRLWDLYKGTLLHVFAVHGGDVKLIVTCPPDINVRILYMHE